MDAAPTRVERFRDVESAVRGVRWLGVAFALAQIGLLYEPPPGVDVPFPRLPVAGAFALALIVLNLVSLWSVRSDSERTIRVAGVLGLVADLVLVHAIVALFAFDPDSRLWPLFVLPILEGALREQVVGAVGSALAALLSNVVVFAGTTTTTAALVSSTTFQAGVLGILAVTVGYLARRFEEARAVAERHALRLRDLAQEASALAAARRTDAVLERLRVVACELTGLELCEIHLREHDAWQRRATTAPGVTLLDVVLERARVDDVTVLETDHEELPDVGQLLVAPIGSGREPAALLILGAPQRRISDTDRDVISLLAGHAAVALDNARIAEAEERTIAELRALDELKDEFVHILGHELRAPMTAMTGYASLLRTRWDQLPPERREEFLASIEEGTFRLARLVRDVQEASMAEGQGLPIDARPVELEELIQRAADAEVGPSPIHLLELAIPEGVPPVHADPDRVAQVLHNLLSNAVKYSPAGGCVRVEVTVGEGSDMVEVAVSDDGLGIPAHLEDHLFRKFARLPTGHRVSGTGLGLYLSRLLVEAMDGRMRVESTEGRGSTFSFTLPAAARKHAAADST